MKPGLYQRLDGTVLKLREDDTWQYLSPLFGEWLDVYAPGGGERLKSYPRNLEIHWEFLNELAMRMACPPFDP